VRSLALLVLFLALFAPRSPAQPQQSFQHRLGGLVFDAFMSDDGQHVWTVEDGGRIRYRNPVATSAAFGAESSSRLPSAEGRSARSPRFLPSPRSRPATWAARSE
jgi:hypothetical protein